MARGDSFVVQPSGGQFVSPAVSHRPWKGVWWVPEHARRPPAERRRAQKWAALSRERLVWRQQQQQIQMLQSVVQVSPRALHRLALVVPHLERQLAGAPRCPLVALRRNVALHARHAPAADAPAAAFRAAQRGPRLGSRNPAAVDRGAVAAGLVAVGGSASSSST